MSFPKLPSKSISGKLKLVIKAPTSVEVEAEREPAMMVPPGSDDKEIKFKLPLGFGMDSMIEDQVKRQMISVHKALDEIEKRYSKCVPCRKKGYWDGATVSIRKCIDLVGPSFAGKITTAPSLIISHEKNGDISFEVRYQTRTLFIISRAASKDSIIGLFERSVEVSNGPFEIEDYSKKLLWVIGYE